MTRSTRVQLSRLSLALVAAMAMAPAFAQSTSSGLTGVVTAANTMAQRAGRPRFVPATRVASVISLGAVAGNLAGTVTIEAAGWSLENGHGYTPLFLYCGGAYLAALALIHILQPRLEPAPSQG